MLKKTKIIATQWPAIAWKEKLKSLYNAGANIIRFNFSHVNYDFFLENITAIKELNESWDTNLSMLLDTKGPEIRTKKTNEVVYLEKWEKFMLTSLDREDNIDKKWMKLIVCNYEYIVVDVEVWALIDIDSWLLKAKVIEKNKWELICEALNSHKVTSLRHLNLPWTKVRLPWITKSDKKDILFWIENNYDFIALSFVRNKWNIQELREFLKENDWETIKIISKIESEEALENIDEIIENSDWIMIARWDLWVEIPFETLPMVQKTIGDKCKQAWKFFIVATQMLESMIINPIPTRAEVTDIFNACMQKADCTMLSWETAAWDYPIQAVKEMKRILKVTESQINYKHNYFSRDLWKDNYKKLLIKNAIYTAEDLEVKAIVVFTNTGFVAKTAAAFRPNLPIFAFTNTQRVKKSLNICFWLKNFVIEKKSNEENIESAKEILLKQNLVKLWEKILVVYDSINLDKVTPTIKIIEF